MVEPLAKISTKTQPTWASDRSSPSSASSVSSASMYNLDEHDTTPIVVFRNGEPNLRITNQHDLCQLLNPGKCTQPFPHICTGGTDQTSEHGYRRYRLTRKPIPRFAPSMEVKRHDCWFSDEKEEFKDEWIYDKSIATIRFPSNIWFGRMLGSFQELYILSPALGRPGSDTSSANSSSQISRSTTFDSDEMGVGADKNDD